MNTHTYEQTQKQTDILIIILCMPPRGKVTIFKYTHTHTHTHARLRALFTGLPGWPGTRKVKPIWILLKQQTVSGSGISWAVCKSAPLSREITTPAPYHSVFYRPDALPAAQPTASKHWRLNIHKTIKQSTVAHNSRPLSQLAHTYACSCPHNIHWTPAAKSQMDSSGLTYKIPYNNYLTIMPKLWLTCNGRQIYKTSYAECNAFLRYTIYTQTHKIIENTSLR